MGGRPTPEWSVTVGPARPAKCGVTAGLRHRLPQERGLGWSIALGTWVVAFVVLVRYEARNFVFPLVKPMFK